MGESRHADERARRRPVGMPRKAHRRVGLNFDESIHVEHVETAEYHVVPRRAGGLQLDRQGVHDAMILATHVSNEHRLVVLVGCRLARDIDHLTRAGNGDDAAIGWMLEELRRMNEFLVHVGPPYWLRMLAAC